MTEKDFFFFEPTCEFTSDYYDLYDSVCRNEIAKSSRLYYS